MQEGICKKQEEGSKSIQTVSIFRIPSGHWHSHAGLPRGGPKKPGGDLLRY